MNSCLYQVNSQLDLDYLILSRGITKPIIQTLVFDWTILPVGRAVMQHFLVIERDKYSIL